MSLYNIIDFVTPKESAKLNDEEVLKRIIKIRKQISRQLFENFKNSLWLPNSLLWEYAVDLPSDLESKNIKLLKKYFIIKDWKIYPRWWAYYFLFWDFYKESNRWFKGKDEAVHFFSSFKKELFSFLNDFEKIIDIDWIEYLVLDNLRNLTLYLFNFILLVYKNTFYQKVFQLPFRFNTKKFSADKIERLLNILIDKYKLIVEEIFKYVFYHWKEINKISFTDKDSLKEIFKELKSIFNLLFEGDIFERKWQVWKFWEVYSSYQSINQFFRKLNRNYREEDNLFVILVTLLQKDVEVLKKLIKTRVNFDDIKSILFKKIKKTYSNKVVASVLYWWVEYVLLAEYFGLPVIFVNYSRYNLWQKDKFKIIDVLSWSREDKDLTNKSVVIFDDNTQSWNTIKDVEEFFKANGIPVISTVWRHVLLSRKKPYYFEDSFIKKNVWSQELLVSTLLRAFSLYYRGDKRLYMPLERKKIELKRHFWRVLKDF